MKNIISNLQVQTFKQQITLYMVQVFQGPEFSGSWSFSVQVILGPGPGVRSSHFHLLVSINYRKEGYIRNLKLLLETGDVFSSQGNLQIR